MDKKIMQEQINNDFSDQKLVNEQPPPPPYANGSQNLQETSRVYNVTYKNIMGKTLYLLDPQSNTPIYEAEYHMLKPHLRVKQNVPVQKDLAQASCHTWTSKLDVEVFGHPEFLLAQGDGGIKSWKKPFSYTSPTLHQTLYFRSRCHYYDYSFSIETEDEQILARVVPSRHSYLKKNVGNLEIFGTHANNAAFVDEMAAMALTMVQYITVHIISRAGAGASAASASSAAAAVAVS